MGGMTADDIAELACSGTKLRGWAKSRGRSPGDCLMGAIEVLSKDACLAMSIASEGCDAAGELIGRHCAGEGREFLGSAIAAYRLSKGPDVKTYGKTLAILDGILPAKLSPTSVGPRLVGEVLACGIMHVLFVMLSGHARYNSGYTVSQKALRVSCGVSLSLVRARTAPLSCITTLNWPNLPSAMNEGTC